MTTADLQFLHRCIQLAELGGTKVIPNPKVGAVIVHNGTIIGEGFHPYSGGPHAEVVAVRDVKDQTLLPDSTIYVSLEPCNHFGKTPPCVDLILEHKIPRVVVGCLDPNPKVAGKGIERLRTNGVEVELAEDVTPFTFLNRAFFVNQLYHRPYITLKWAQTADGFIAGHDEAGNGIPIKITDFPSDVLVHKLRASHQAILVGRKTALSDDPSLTTRYYPGESPLRIVFDRKGTLPRTLKLFTDGNKTMILGAETTKTENVAYYSPTQWTNLSLLLEELYSEKGICSILVEGGREILQQFIDQGVYDEIICFEGHKKIHAGIPAPTLASSFSFDSTRFSGQDIVKQKIIAYRDIQ